MPRNRLQTRAAFTLVEVVVVITLLGILAVAARPALSTLDATRAGGATQEVSRRLAMARAAAVGSGTSVGLSLTPATGVLQTVRIPAGGGAPAAQTDPLGQPDPGAALGALFPSAQITGVTGFTGVSGAATLWFAFDGTPEVRSSGGVLLGPPTQDARVDVRCGASTGVVWVRRVSGLIE